MVYCISDHIVSPLARGSETNYRAVLAGGSALCHHEGMTPDPITASLFTAEQWAEIMVDGLTRFESLVVQSARRAIADAAIDVASPRAVLIIGTTKGNIDLLRHDRPVDERVYPGTAAQRIADALGFTTTPIVACNACISGVAALVLAQQLLEAGIYDHAVVCGADVQSRFTVSGFQALKATSQSACRPFDMERTGLNLGEAAATMVLQRNAPSVPAFAIMAGAIRNDAFHVSSPSKNGEGAFLALEAIKAGEHASELAFVNAHGTATMFNDQMESVAIERAGLADVPVNGLKGYYGHTMGAAGVLETVISMHALRDHTIVGTRGYSERGVSGHISLSSEHQPTGKSAFVKMISGFGGGNAALLCTLPSTSNTIQPTLKRGESSNGHQHHVLLTPGRLVVDGVEQPTFDSLTTLYKRVMGDYPKYYKMDLLARLALVATEVLLQAEGGNRFVPRHDRAVVFFNRTSSVIADRDYLASIDGDEGYYPSPGAFVYTLPNLAVGEVAMRNHYHGETSFYILPQRDDALIAQVAHAAHSAPGTTSLITGWLDYPADGNYIAQLYLLNKA